MRLPALAAALALLAIPAAAQIDVRSRACPTSNGAPTTCSSSHEGQCYVDAADHLLRYCNSTSWVQTGSSITVPGSDTQVIFNDGGALGADAGMTYNKTTDTLTAGAFVGPLTGNASTATALAADPADCVLPNVALGVNASGVAQCAQPSNVTGNAATATTATTASALAADPADCTLPNVALGINASGVAQCAQPSNVSGNAATASALAADPSACSANQFVTDIAAAGTLTCVQPAASNLSNGTTGSNAVVLATSPTLDGTVSAASSTADIGSTTAPFRDVYLHGSGTFGSASIKLTGAPSANRVVTFPNGSLTVAGINFDSVWSSNQSFDFGSRLYFGPPTTANNVILYHTNLTPDGAMLGTGTVSNSWHINENQDLAFDFQNGNCGTSACTDPSLWIHSHNQATDQWIGMWHDGTDGFLRVGSTGGLVFKDNGYKKGLIFESSASATKRFHIYIGDATNGTLADEVYYSVISSTGHFSGGSAGDTEVFAYTATAGQQGLYIGPGITSSSPQSYTIWGTGGSGSNIAGSNLSLQAGLSTGNAVPALLKLKGAALGGASGSTAQTSVDRMILNATKVLANNTTTTVTNVTVASDTVAAVIVHYAVEVNDGASHHQQVEVGNASCTVTNANGSLAGNTCTKYGNTQAISASGGTLTVTWSITAANPALLQVNSNTGTITPATGFPRVTYTLENLTSQAVAIQ